MAELPTCVAILGCADVEDALEPGVGVDDLRNPKSVILKTKARLIGGVLGSDPTDEPRWPLTQNEFKERLA